MAQHFWKSPYTTLLLIVVVLIAFAPLSHIHHAAAQGGGTHTVQAGENLFRIALNYGVSVEYLASLNGIPDPTKIFVGQVLVIPGDEGAQTATANTAPAFAVDSPAVNPAPAADTVPAPAPEPVIHVVQAGEHLAVIAAHYGVAWQDVANANGITNPSLIYSGQELTIPGVTANGTGGPLPAADDTTATATESVPAAETTVPVAAAPDPVIDLGIIAPPVSQSPAPIAPAAPASSAPSVALVPSAGDRTHVVLGGEHLAAIAKKYGLSWPTLAMANNIDDPNSIYPGQTLIIPAQDYDPNSYTPRESTYETPTATLASGKQIVVDISDQRVYAFENGALVRNVLVSTGTNAFPTVQGDYNVYLKYDSQNMSGPGYYLPGVPWVMYFYQGYSLHGTYWHSNWGTPMSHGCVNMPTPEANWLYSWAPMGTAVHVQW